MSFIPISIDIFVKLQVTSGSPHSEVEMREMLQRALEFYNNNKTCNCGHDIWVVGSAFAGEMKCFSCLTGSDNSECEYELAQALEKDVYVVHQAEKDIPLPELCDQCLLKNDPASFSSCNATRSLFTGDVFFCSEFQF